MKVFAPNPKKGYISNWLWLPKTNVNVAGVKASLTFMPDGNRQQEVYRLYDETEDHVLVPRAMWMPEDFKGMEFVDIRPTRYKRTKITSRIVLDVREPLLATQRDSVRSMQDSSGGILQLGCGLGKTCCALELIAREGVPAIIVVDNTQLAEQWQEEIDKFLVLDEPLGLIGAGKSDWKRSVVLATYQILFQKAEQWPEEMRSWFGLAIFDEAHHLGGLKWSKIAPLFYGKRIGLTATPDRVDGSDYIYTAHLGKVLYKNLKQPLRPNINFLWTGYELDLNDRKVVEQTCDVNGEIHIAKLSGFLGSWRERLDMITNELARARLDDRHVLVLSYSVAELVNLFCIYNGQSLYTDIKYPDIADLNIKFPEMKLIEEPEELSDSRLTSLSIELQALMEIAVLGPTPAIEARMKEIRRRLEKHRSWKELELEFGRRQREFIHAVTASSSDAGLLIGEIGAKVRHKMLRTKKVLFAIMKYGREGLDNPGIDTVVVCEPVNQKNILQQIMGRALRVKAGKKKVVILVLEDNIGPMLGMCGNLRKELLSWPVEEGGPFFFDHVNHPHKASKGDWLP